MKKESHKMILQFEINLKSRRYFYSSLKLNYKPKFSGTIWDFFFSQAVQFKRFYYQSNNYDLLKTMYERFSNTELSNSMKERATKFQYKIVKPKVTT